MFWASWDYLYTLYSLWLFPGDCAGVTLCTRRLWWKSQFCHGVLDSRLVTACAIDARRSSKGASLPNKICHEFVQSQHTSPQVLIAVVLMLMWSPNFPKSRFDFLDLFAGAANASEFWCLASIYLNPSMDMTASACSQKSTMRVYHARASRGLRVATVDIDRSEHMDVCTRAGFLQLDLQ